MHTQYCPCSCQRGSETNSWCSNELEQMKWNGREVSSLSGNVCVSVIFEALVPLNLVGRWMEVRSRFRMRQSSTGTEMSKCRAVPWRQTPHLTMTAFHLQVKLESIYVTGHDYILGGFSPLLMILTVKYRNMHKTSGNHKGLWKDKPKRIHIWNCTCTTNIGSEVHL